jgi:hypothetical protein
MSSKIIIVLMWTVAAAVGCGAFIVGTSAFDRYVVSDPPERAGSTSDAPYESLPTRVYDDFRSSEPD